MELSLISKADWDKPKLDKSASVVSILV